MQGAEEQEEFLDLCNEVKKMAEEEISRKRKYEGPGSEKEAGVGGLQSKATSHKPVVMYGPIAPSLKDKDVGVVESSVEMSGEEVPKKKGKIKRRGRKKGKRKKPDREDEVVKDSSKNAMEC